MQSKPRFPKQGGITVNLKSCPWCGGDEITIEQHRRIHNGYTTYITCKSAVGKCPRPMMVSKASVEDTAAKWNRRDGSDQECPFCASAPSIFQWTDTISCRCPDDECMSVIIDSKKLADVLSKWGNRTPSTKTVDIHLPALDVTLCVMCGYDLKPTGRVFSSRHEYKCAWCERKTMIREADLAKPD